MTVLCNATLSAVDDVVESPDPTSTSSFSPLECTYSITVYAGYGVEMQVMNSGWLKTVAERLSANNNQICDILGEEGQSFEERVPDDYGLWGFGT